MVYNIDYKKSVGKDTRELPLGIKILIKSEIIKLSQNPFPHGVKALTGYSSCYRIRIRDYRVIYFVNPHDQIITISKIAHRKDIYRDLQKMS